MLLFTGEIKALKLLLPTIIMNSFVDYFSVKTSFFACLSLGFNRGNPATFPFPVKSSVSRKYDEHASKN
jgi:hypothetical protein